MASRIAKEVFKALNFYDVEVIQEVLDTFFLKVLPDALQENDEVKTPYGTFRKKVVTKTIYDFQTKEVIEKEVTLIKFKPNSKLKAAVKKGD